MPPGYQSVATPSSQNRGTPSSENRGTPSSENRGTPSSENRGTSTPVDVVEDSASPRVAGDVPNFVTHRLPPDEAPPVPPIVFHGQ